MSSEELVLKLIELVGDQAFFTRSCDVTIDGMRDQLLDFLESADFEYTYGGVQCRVTSIDDFDELMMICFADLVEFDHNLSIIALCLWFAAIDHGHGYRRSELNMFFFNIRAYCGAVDGVDSQYLASVAVAIASTLLGKQLNEFAISALEQRNWGERP